MSRTVEITTRNENRHYTKIVIDGVEIDRIVAIRLDIGVNNIAYLTIERHATTDEGHQIVGHDEIAVITQTVVFTGEIKGSLSQDLAQVITAIQESQD